LQVEADAAISEAEAEGRTAGLEAAREFLAEAEQAYASGDYTFGTEPGVPSEGGG